MAARRKWNQSLIRSSDRAYLWACNRINMIKYELRGCHGPALISDLRDLSTVAYVIGLYSDFPRQVKQSTVATKLVRAALYHYKQSKVWTTGSAKPQIKMSIWNLHVVCMNSRYCKLLLPYISETSFFHSSTLFLHWYAHWQRSIRLHTAINMVRFRILVNVIYVRS